MATDITIGLSLVEVDEKLNEMLVHPSRFRALMLKVEVSVCELVERGRVCDTAHLVPALLDAMYDRLRRLDPFCQGTELDQ